MAGEVERCAVGRGRGGERRGEEKGAIVTWPRCRGSRARRDRRRRAASPDGGGDGAGGEGGGWRVEGLVVAEGPGWAGEEGGAAGSVTSLESPLYSSSTRGPGCSAKVVLPPLPGCSAWWTPSALIRTTGRVRRSDATTARCRCCSPGGRGAAAVASASASCPAAPTLKWEGRRSSESRRISWR